MKTPYMPREIAGTMARADMACTSALPAKSLRGHGKNARHAKFPAASLRLSWHLFLSPGTIGLNSSVSVCAFTGELCASRWLGEGRGE